MRDTEADTASIIHFMHLCEQCTRISYITDTYSVTSETFRLFSNPKAHYCVHKGPPLVHFLSRINHAHTYQPHFSKCILILLCHLRLGIPSGLFPLGFTTEILNLFFICPTRGTRSVHLILLHLTTQIITGEEYKL
jgi:hypothetical protein